MRRVDKIYGEKSIPITCVLLCGVTGVQHSVIMADIVMSETQHTIIVIIYSSYFLEVLVELYVLHNCT